MSSTGFALYDGLVGLGGEPPSTETLHRLTTAMNGLPIQNANEIALILIHHYGVQNPGLRFEENVKGLPYGARIGAGGKGLSFSLDRLPADLKCILCRYFGL